MKRAAVVTAAAALLVAAGCGSPARDGRPAHAGAARETAWIAKLQRRLETEFTQGTFRDCTRRIERRVGPPPSRSLDDLAARLHRMCEHFEAYHRAEDSAFAEHDAAAYERSRKEEALAEAAFRDLREHAASYRPGRGTRELPVVARVTARSHVEPTLGRVATAIARQRLRVRCWSVDDWPGVVRNTATRDDVFVDYHGFAWIDENVTDLAPAVCEPLERFVYDRRRRPTIALATAVGTLAHEATHLGATPVDDEALTECWAMQQIARATRLLGGSAALGRRLALLYLRDVHPFVPPGYRSRECRDGGAFDLRPDDRVWP